MIKDRFFDLKCDKYDNLTNVYRREVMYEYIDCLINNKIPFSYAILDVDNFKYINDNYGHLFGDVVLSNIAMQLKKVISLFNGVIGRYGGDEFIIVFEEDLTYDEQWKKCFDMLKSPIAIDYKDIKDFSWTYTIGMSKYPYDADNFNDLMNLADKALYRGKTKGRNCFIIYLEEKHKEILLNSQRNKVYSPLYLQRKIFTELTRKTDNINTNINNILNFIGTHLMIDQLSIEYNNSIVNAYSHPLASNISIKVLGNDNISEIVRTNVNYLCENNTLSQKINNGNKLYAKFIEYNILATVIVEIKVYNRSYGYLRADMVLPGTGRIWQNSDISLLIELANIISLVKYVNEK